MYCELFVWSFAKILKEKSVVMLAYIIDAAGSKIKFLQHGDSV